MRIYIVRHGETDANLRGVFQGRVNSQLLESGFELARQVGAALVDVRFDAAFSSPLSRAWDTARTVLDASGNADVPLQREERLLEISMGDFEGKRFRPGEREVDAEAVRLFFEDPFAFAGFPGGEDVHAVMARTQGFLAELAAREFNTVLVSTHGFALRAMLNGLYGDPSDFWQGYVPYNCSLSIVEAEADADAGAKMRLVASDLVLYDQSLVVDRYARH
jgi:broad specificity phosphatase PhoE